MLFHVSDPAYRRSVFADERSIRQHSITCLFAIMVSLDQADLKLNQGHQLIQASQGICKLEKGCPVSQWNGFTDTDVVDNKIALEAI